LKELGIAGTFLHQQVIPLLLLAPWAPDYTLLLATHLLMQLISLLLRVEALVAVLAAQTQVGVAAELEV
jgi:hypothetical protein